MNPLPASVGAPALPQVSLIPPEFAKRSRRAQMRALAVIIALVGVGLLVVWWFFAVGLKTVAEGDLAEEQARRADLTAELATYDYVREAQTAHDRSIAAEGWVTSTDIRWDAYIAAIANTLPSGVTIQQIQLQQVSPAGGNNGGASSGGVFSQPGLGFIAMNARASEPELSNEWIVALSQLSGITNVQITDARLETLTDTNRPVWSFTIIADVSLQAHSGRTILVDEDAVPVDDGTDTTGEATE